MSVRRKRCSARRVCAALGAGLFAVGGASASASAGLPARENELVSVADKGGYPVLWTDDGANMGVTKLSRDGNLALYVSWGSFADSRDGMPKTYRATRSASGWRTQAASPRVANPTPDAIQEFTNYWRQATPDLQFGLVRTRDNLDPAADPAATTQVYTSTSEGNPTLVTRRADGTPADAGTPYDLGISDDGARGYFTTDGHMVPEDAGRLAGQDVYARIGDRTVLVSESGGAPLSACGSVLGGASFFTSSATTRNAIAESGRQVVFSAPIGNLDFGFDPSCFDVPRIYLRSDTEGLVQVSASEATVPESPQSAAYEGASADGTRILFTSQERLVDGAPSGGLYLYRSDLPRGNRLRLLVPATNVFVAKTSEDARTIYFTSQDPVAPGGSGGNALYVYRDSESGETLRWIADDAAFDFGAFSGGSENFRKARISADGNVLAFLSSAPLTGFDNTRSGGGGATGQLFVYDDRVGLSCASCNSAGQRPTDSPVSGDASVGTPNNGDPNPNTISDDGRHVFFMSPDRLVAGDVNSKRDVYEYSDGRVQLISAGRGPHESVLADVSASGETALFATADSLVPQDRDGGDVDVYVAREGGGFPPPPPIRSPEVGCDDDGCQGPTTPSPAEEVPGSAQFDGEDSAPPVMSRPTVRLVRPGSAALKALARTGSAKLEVRATGPGLVKVILAARIGRRTRSAGGGRARAGTGASAVQVPLKLSRAARRELVKRKRLTVRVRATIAERATTPTLTLVLRNSASPSRGGRR